MTSATISPTDDGYFADHRSDALRDIVERYTANGKAIAANGSPELAVESLAIANNAWAELVMRGEA